ncbi:hypothetical protein Pyrfu_0440 [Pyrolobus fumarii 1A]|uniref:Uncharacterized protein n=1 Tax=Pyrolobus fumarii (strain DSM 11204 / 1A) TaxID=694429 RepID=G0EG63_PYRF1|nr:hypothetical protein Pyrfu_0440 [Pyrolobus fumarii 1A]
MLVERLRRLEERLLEAVNSVLAGLGAEPLRGVTLSLREEVENAEDEHRDPVIRGRYLPDEHRVILYSGAGLGDLLHELVHHLQAAGHGMVEVDAVLAREGWERLPYAVRPDEVEALILAERLLDKMPRDAKEKIIDVLAEFNGLRKLFYPKALLTAYPRGNEGVCLETLCEPHEYIVADRLRRVRVRAYRIYARGDKLGVEILLDMDGLTGFASIESSRLKEIARIDPSLDLIWSVASETGGVLVQLSRDNMVQEQLERWGTPYAVLAYSQAESRPLLEVLLSERKVRRSTQRLLDDIIGEVVGKEILGLGVTSRGDPEECFEAAKRLAERVKSKAKEAIDKLISRGEKHSWILLVPTWASIKVELLDAVFEQKGTVYLVLHSEEVERLATNIAMRVRSHAVNKCLERSLGEMPVAGTELELEVEDGSQSREARED